jgi:putative peptide zinc metalloprotease protein
VTTARIYKLREDLIIRRRVFGDDVRYVVKDPLTREFFTIDEVSHTLLTLCDGRRDLHEISEAASRFFPPPGVDPITVLNFCESYRPFHFFEDAWQRNTLLIARRRTSRMRRLRQTLANPLEIHLPAWDPDRFFDRIVHPLRFLFTGKALLVYAALIVSALWISSTHSRDFMLSFGELWVIKGKTLLGILVLWLTLFFTVVLHEFGHGLTCKHYGGEVHKMGFLFLYFNPCLYCDVTESYFFEDRRKKHAVTMGGGIVDLLTASVATLVWFFTSPDLFLNEVAHRVAIFNGVSGILVNYNPLMRYDGYFLLSDHLGIPSLREDSMQFLGGRIRALLGLPHEEESRTRRERKIFWIYGILAVCYSIFVLWFILRVVGGWLIGRFHGVGYLVTFALVFLMTRRYARSLAGFIRFVGLDKAAHFRRRRLAYFGGAAALLAAFFFLPCPRHVQGRFAFLPGEEAALRAEEPAVIESVLADEGNLVPAGTAPVLLRSVAVEREGGQARALLAASEAGRAAAQVAGDASQAAVYAAGTDAGRAIEEHSAARARRLSPVAPFPGVVLTRRLREAVGSACQPGDTLCLLGDLRTLRAEVLLDERDYGRLWPDGAVELRTQANPGNRLRGRLESVAPVASGDGVRRIYRLLVRVENDRGALRPGVTGVARFDAGRVPPVRRLLDGLARIFRIEFWV